MSENQILMSRAKSALLAHDYDLAAKLYKTLIQENPDDLTYKIQLGNLYVKSGKDEQALLIFEEILKIDSSNSDVMMSLGGVYRRQKKFEDSVEIFKNALNYGADSSQVSYNLGFTYRQMGKYELAIECFENVVDEKPEDVLAWNHLGAIHALQKNHKEAISSYQKGLKVDPNHPVLQLNIAKSYAKVGEIAKALSSYEGALKAKPGWLEAIDDYANLLLESNMVKEADEVVTNALELNPEDIKMHTVKGHVYNRQCVYDNAEKEFRKALDSNASFTPALRGLAFSQERQGKNDEAAETIQKALELNVETALESDILKESAGIFLSANQVSKAYEKISKLWDMDKNDVETVNLLGQYYIIKGDEKKVENCFDKIEQLQPGYSKIYKDWGCRFMQCGDNLNAEKYLKVAASENPDDSHTLVQLASFYESQNQIEKAYEFYEKAAEKDEFNLLAKKNKEKLNFGKESLRKDISFNRTKKISDSDLLDGVFSGKAEEVPVDDSKFFEEENAESESSALLSNFQQIVDDPELISFDNNNDEELTENNPVDFIEKSEMAGAAQNDISVDSDEAFQEDDSFNFDQFGKENIVIGADDDDDIVSISKYLENEELESKARPDDIEGLLDDGAPIDEEDDVEIQVIPDGTVEIEEESKIVEPAPVEKVTVREIQVPVQMPKAELSEESMKEIEDRIKEATDAAEKATFAAEKAWNAAQSAADSVQAIEKYPKEETPQQELSMQRAIDMLPTIMAAIENRSSLYRFRSSLDMFIKLREMLEFLPPAQKKQFLTSKNRLMLDYIISKLSGKPGLYATATALRNSGLLHDIPELQDCDKEGLELTQEVLLQLRDLSKNVEDEYLRDAIDTEVLKLIEKIS